MKKEVEREFFFRIGKRLCEVFHLDENPEKTEQRLMYPLLFFIFLSIGAVLIDFYRFFAILLLIGLDMVAILITILSSFSKFTLGQEQSSED